jgi:hypothetical protein
MSSAPYTTDLKKTPPGEGLQQLGSNALMLATQVGNLNSLFFKLPLEIRNIIYEYLWASKILSLK